MTAPANLSSLFFGSKGIPFAVDSVGGSSVLVTSQTITLPTHAIGDLLLLFYYKDGNTLPSISTSGWTYLGVSAFGASAAYLVGYRIATSVTTSISVANNATEDDAYALYSIRGHDGNAPTMSTPAQNTSTNADPSAVTGLTANNYLMFASASTDGGTNITAPPTGYSTLVGGDSGTGVGFINGYAVWKETYGVTSEDPGTFTNNSDQWVAMTVAVGAP